MIGGGLVALLAANYYLRSTLEDAPRYLNSFLGYFYPHAVPILFNQMPAWHLFLPLPVLNGAWVSTSLILTYLIERVLTPAGTWYLYNALAILVAFGASWALFRSMVFSFTLAICMGFGTQFYHAYAVSGGIASYLVASYHMLLLFTTAQVVRGATPVPLWWVGLAVSLLLNMLGYEGWLDVVVLVWVSAPFAYFWLRHLERSDASARLLRVVGVITTAGVVYIVIKVTLGYGQRPGAESDIVFNYTSLWLVADDLVSNVFSNVYLSLSNFLPPMFVGASSGYRLGFEEVIKAQHGYHVPFHYLVAMNQVFFWRYYAGAALAVLVYAIYRVAVRLRTHPSTWTFALLMFLLMLVVPGATHMLIKFRPMNAMPVMTYHVTVGVIGASGLIAWLLATAWRVWPGRTVAVLIVAVWATIFYGALARPPYLAYMAAQSGMGTVLYPNPMKSLVERLGMVYAVPPGLLFYTAFDDDISKVRALLADLLDRLPPVDTWDRASDEISMTSARAGGVDVQGDDTQFGYQLVSPAISLRPESMYLMRVRFEVDQGRVCAGILSGDQKHWVVRADGATAEFMFNSGGMGSVHVVLANCHLRPVGNLGSRFHVAGGSYSLLQALDRTP